MGKYTSTPQRAKRKRSTDDSTEDIGVRVGDVSMVQQDGMEDGEEIDEGHKCVVEEQRDIKRMKEEPSLSSQQSIPFQVVYVPEFSAYPPQRPAEARPIEKPRKGLTFTPLRLPLPPAHQKRQGQSTSRSETPQTPQQVLKRPDLIKRKRSSMNEEKDEAVSDQTSNKNEDNEENLITTSTTKSTPAPQPLRMSSRPPYEESKACPSFVGHVIDAPRTIVINGITMKVPPVSFSKDPTMPTISSISSENLFSSSYTTPSTSSIPTEAQPVNKHIRKHSPPRVPQSKDVSRYKFDYQRGKCLSKRYREQAGLCTSCIRRKTGFKCWFEGMRVFEYDVSNESKLVSGPYFMTLYKNRAEGETEVERFRGLEDFAIPLDGKMLLEIGKACADNLMEGLDREIVHWKIGEKKGEKETVWKIQDIAERSMCDGCLTGIWAGFYLCEKCGRSFCYECYGQLRNGSESKIIAACVGPSRKQGRHGIESFRRFSFYSLEELETLKNDIEEIKKRSSPLIDLGGLDLRKLPREQPALNHPHALPYIKLSKEPSCAVFRQIWALGEPVVIQSIKYEKHLWTPAELGKRYGDQDCIVENCQSGESKEAKVKEFLDMFGEDHMKKVLKLKDWPPTQDFETSFPDLYQDFASFVPIPQVTRKDGPFNIAAYYPENGNLADLGPKMYLAFKSKKGRGGKGSTKLHMDVADAVNIMTYAINEDGSEGAAAWDIFPASSSDKIREYLYHHRATHPDLRDQFNGETVEEKIIDAKLRQDDPIHTQHFYLEESMLKELSESPWNVKSYRIIQRPGEAVFIPAGCAHQVCNMSDCIKVAIDFVSIENMERCKKLTREFRLQTKSVLWKEDVLRLRSMAYWAWIACQHYQTQGVNMLGGPDNQKLEEEVRRELEAILSFAIRKGYATRSRIAAATICAQLQSLLSKPPDSISLQKINLAFSFYMTLEREMKIKENLGEEEYEGEWKKTMLELEALTKQPVKAVEWWEWKTSRGKRGKGPALK